MSDGVQAGAEGEYRVAFRARAREVLDAGVARALGRALDAMPGIERVETAVLGEDGADVSGAFWISVRLGMADAARDGSRLAKEALKVAGLGDSQLVELGVVMGADPFPD
jgi:hypothetical protein